MLQSAYGKETRILFIFSHEAMEILDKVRAQVKALEDRLAFVEKQHQDALDEQREVQEDAQRCKDRLKLAERLVSGLATENQRWSLRVKHLQEKMGTLVGDVLLSAAFVSYIGNCFFFQCPLKATRK